MQVSAEDFFNLLAQDCDSPNVERRVYVPEAFGRGLRLSAINSWTIESTFLGRHLHGFSSRTFYGPGFLVKNMSAKNKNKLRHYMNIYFAANIILNSESISYMDAVTKQNLLMGDDRPLVSARMSFGRLSQRFYEDQGGEYERYAVLR